MLCSVGDLVEDVIVIPSAALRHGTDVEATILRRRGGSAANVVADAVALGGAARFIGQVGTDHLGDALIAQLAATGVDVRAVRFGRSGTIVVVVDADGERSFFTDTGTSRSLATIPDEWLHGVTCLHVPWYSLAAGEIATASRTAIARSRSQGALISIDASSVALLADAAAVRHELETLAPDVLLANDDESAALSLLGDPIAGVRLTVVKRGANPVMLADCNGRTTTVDVLERFVPIDTTGAGDAFAAGFLLSMMSGASDIDAATAGHAAAASRLRANMA